MVCDSSEKVNFTQLVGDQKGNVIVPVLDWKEWFDPGSVPVKAVKKGHQFFFTKEKDGEISIISINLVIILH